MDSQPPTECACGSTNFERVVVRRPSGSEYRTDFIACVECRVMYFDPVPPGAPIETPPDARPGAFWMATGPKG